MQDVSLDGVTPTRTALTAGDTLKVANDGRVLLAFEKSGVGAAVVTLTTPATVAGGVAVADPTVTVPASTGDVVVGPFPAGIFSDDAGDLSFSVDDDAGLTVAVLRLPQV